MPPPAKPSDPPTSSKPEAQKPDSNLNLLGILDSAKKDALAPAVNSFAVEPVNAVLNVVNGASEGATWLYNKAAGTTHAAPAVPKLGEMEVGNPHVGGVGYYSKQIFGTAGSFLAYAAAGKIAGKAMRTLGELTPLEMEIKNLKVGLAARSFAQDTRVASVFGATAYAGLKDPKQGESRFSNAASTFIGFSAFEIGNTHLVSPGAPLAFRLGQQYFVGAMGGAAQTNVASLIQEHKLADKDASDASALGGGLLNMLIPRGRVAIESIAEGRYMRQLPHVPEASARLHADAVRELTPGQPAEPGSWANAKAVKAVNRAALGDLHTTIKVGDEGPTRIDQQKNIVYHSKGDDPLNVIQELAHRRVFRAPEFERQFKQTAGEIHSLDPSDPRNAVAIEKYVQIRVQQEVAARGEQNAAAIELGSPKRVSVNAHEIRFGEGYDARFELEAHDFIRTGGKTRPVVDHSSGPEIRLASSQLTKPAGSESTQPPDLNIVAGTDTLDPAGKLRIERSRLDRWEDNARDILASNTAPQDRPQNNLFNVIKDRMVATGVASEGWVLLPTQTGSPLDQVGCDFAMINRRSMQVVLVDATQNPEKLLNPGGKNVSQIRVDGVIGFDNKLIDIGGRLKVDEPGMTGQRARDLQDDIDKTLRFLADEGSPITSDMLPSFRRQSSPLESQGQVDQFRLALQKKALELSPDDRNRILLEEYARDLGRGASRHNELLAATVESRPLTDAVSKGADRVVLDYVLGKMRIKDVASTINGSPNVKIHKDGHILVSVEGTIYDGGNVQEAVAEARRSLRIDSDKLTSLLQRDKSVLRAMQRDHLTIEQIRRRVQEVLVESREIDNGMYGTNELGLKEAVRNRISNNQPENLVTGRVEKPKEKAPRPETLTSAFSAAQQAEIPNIAASMSEFHLNVQDGIDPQDLKAFIEMYREGTPSGPARELCDQYLVDVDKPVTEQRFIPKLHGALVAAQMRAQSQLVAEFGDAAAHAVKSAADGPARAADASGNGVKSDAPELTIEQVKLALDRLKELEAVAHPTAEEQRQIEALRAFQAHILDAPTRGDVARLLAKLGKPGATLTPLIALAVLQWQSESARDKLRHSVSPRDDN